MAGKRWQGTVGDTFFGVLVRMAYHRFRGGWLDYDRPEDRDLNASLGEFSFLVVANIAVVLYLCL